MDPSSLSFVISLDLPTVGLYVVLVAAGVVAGFINTMAGGGSLLTLPVLMLLGLPPSVANGTNRLSVVSQSLSGVLAFHGEGKLHTQAAVSVVSPTILGALIGAFAAAWAPEEVLEPVLLGMLIAMALVMAVAPRLVLPNDDEAPRGAWKSPASLFGLFGAGLYGGFIQAGVGFVLLAVLGGLLRYDAVRANALKLLCTLLFSLAGLAIFVAHGQVNWAPAIVLAAGTVLGSRLGVRFAVKADPRKLRAFIFVCVVASCVGAFLKS